LSCLTTAFLPEGIGLADCGKMVYNSQETLIRPQDFALLQVVETAEEAVETLSGFSGA
jgi:hypothetical protein